jgi:fucose permease
MLILASILAIFVYGLIAAFLGTVLPALSERFQMTPKQNGSIASAQALGLIIASLAVGPLIDAEGKKLALVIGLALVAGALSYLPRCKSFGALAMTLFALGMGGGIVVTGANTLARDAGGTHAAAVLNLVNLFFGLGGLITPFLSANLFKGNFARLGYFIAGLTILALVVQCIAPIPAPVPSPGGAFAGAGAVLTRPTLYLLGSVLFLYVSCEVGIWNWLVQFLKSRGIPEKTALNVLSLGFALGMLLGRLAVSTLFAKISSETVILISSGAMAITTLLLLFTHTSRGAWVLVFLAGLAMAPVFPTTLDIVGRVFPQNAGTAIGIAITFGWVGLAISSRIIGAIAGGETTRIRKSLVVLPVFSTVMVALSLVIRNIAR